MLEHLQRPVAADADAPDVGKVQHAGSAADLLVLGLRVGVAGGDEPAVLDNHFRPGRNMSIMEGGPLG